MTGNSLLNLHCFEPEVVTAGRRMESLWSGYIPWQCLSWCHNSLIHSFTHRNPYHRISVSQDLESRYRWIMSRNGKATEGIVIENIDTVHPTWFISSYTNLPAALTIFIYSNSYLHSYSYRGFLQRNRQGKHINRHYLC